MKNQHLLLALDPLQFVVDVVDLLPQGLRLLLSIDNDDLVLPQGLPQLRLLDLELACLLELVVQLVAGILELS